MSDDGGCKLCVGGGGVEEGDVAGRWRRSKIGHWAKAEAQSKQLRNRKLDSEPRHELTVTKSRSFKLVAVVGDSESELQTHCQNKKKWMHRGVQIVGEIGEGV
ncbi:hypothetical protein CDL15_Pgr011843 [Punica granatum]|uniref:Uncharacterized protein n=1 Tax=Punica granatum TaxID=22663 RepID=A0A218XFA2_PUNGR|nr:hypothetical protein CDL15_Pgr011843 [Punica granatum]PKI58655.1 hypothetical protein CRG98_020921 [Punica granatum]